MSQLNHTHIQVEVCSRCFGRGETEHKEMTDYHKCEYQVTFITCNRCEGSGRVIKVESTEYKPLNEHNVEEYL